MVRIDVSLVPTDAGANAFATASAAFTVSVALAATVLAPAFAEVTAPIGSVLAYEPDAALVTLTVTVHAPPAGIVPPESATLLPPFAAVTAPAPHVVAPPARAVLTRPAG